ncbi:hypothetical protein GOBAR_DD00194 [Gossypium barbadense]|nr:hypothetical protein GOBAR_DD00194 [Gossypium barbadense]
MDEGQSSMMEAQLANLTAMRDHPNFKNQNRATPPRFEQQNSRPYNMSQLNHQNLSAETKTHTMLEQMMKMMSDEKKETNGRFQALETVVKQLQTRASSADVNLGNFQAQVDNRLPSQSVANPRDNVSAVTLRSGKELRPILKKVQNSNEESETERRIYPYRRLIHNHHKPTQERQKNYTYNSPLFRAMQQILSRKRKPSSLK